MSELRYEEWMSESDSVLWHIERDPILRSTITSVWFLDSTPRRERMDAMIDRVVAAVPRLRQRVVDDRPGLAPPRWVDEPQLDVDYHYSWVRLPGRRVGRRAVLDFAQRFAARAFDKDRPLWELCVVEGLPGGRSAFVMKIHHAIADGLGMVQLLEHMVDLEADPTAGPVTSPAAHQGAAALRRSAVYRVVSPLGEIAGARSWRHRMVSEARTGMRLAHATLRTSGDLLRDPMGTVGRLTRTTGSIARVVKPATTPLSPVMVERSLSTWFEPVAVPFDDLKAVARTAGATLNDVFVTVTLDALRRYHDELDAGCDEIRMNMPVSIRGGDAANRFDNQFVPARIVLPLSEGDVWCRIDEVKRILREVRDEPALPHVNDISGVIARLGPAAAVSVLGAMLKGVDITTSNVPGPPFPVFMAGSRIDEFYAFGPLAGAAVNITLFSYDGRVFLGVNADRAAVDHGRFARCLHAAITETLASAAR
jgi:WS/DGAT/MGAT family acyltransferase